MFCRDPCLQTQFEGWLAMQAGSSMGLGAPLKGRERCAIKCLHNATTGTEDVKLRSMWSKVTPDEAHADGGANCEKGVSSAISITREDERCTWHCTAM